MPKGKVLEPEKMRKIASLLMQNGGIGVTEAAGRAGVSRFEVSRLMKKLYAANIFVQQDLDALSDEQLFKIMYAAGRAVSNADGTAVSFDIGRTDEQSSLVPDFTKLAIKRADEKKSCQDLWFSYLDECASADKKPLSRSTFYKHLRRAVKELTRGQNAVIINDHPYGYETQIDYAGTKFKAAMADGTQVEFIIVIICWAASGYMWAGFIEHANTVETCRAIGRAFKHFGVVSETLLSDNALALVSKHHRGKEALFNPTYLNYLTELGIDPTACNPYSPSSKSQVEYAVRLICVRVLPAMDGSIPHTKTEWDFMLMKLVDEKINNVAFKGGPLSRADRFMQYEKPAARALLRCPAEPAQVFECKVGRTYHVRINGHLYSVPYKYIGLSVTVKYTDSDVSIYSEGTEIAHHARSFADGLTTLPEHMPEHHRQYRNSLSRYKTDEELLKRAAEVSPEALKYCTWRLTKSDHQRIRSCVAVLNFVSGAAYPKLVNQAISIMMHGSAEKRSYYTLLAIYKELCALAQGHDGQAPEQLELDFAERSPAPWDDKNKPDAYIANTPWQHAADDNKGSSGSSGGQE